MASNIEVASYDPKKVNLVMNGKIITGFASDSMITIARNEDTVTTQVGVKGDVAYNENANESGTITVTLMGTSSSLPYVRSLALKRKEVSVMIVDANDVQEISSLSMTADGRALGVEFSGVLYNGETIRVEVNTGG